MNKKKVLIFGGLAVAAYLIYRWYMSKQANGTASPTGALGTNLNSVAPELVGGSSGPSSGLTYYAGTTTVNLTMPSGGPTITQSAPRVSNTSTSPVHEPPPRTPIRFPG